MFTDQEKLQAAKFQAVRNRYQKATLDLKNESRLTTMRKVLLDLKEATLPLHAPSR